jgi:histidine triad (HIT) family protein
MSNLEAMSLDPSQSPDSASTSPAGLSADPSDPGAPEPTAIASGAAANDTIFGRILRGEIPCDAVYADDLCLAFRDVNPQAPVHVLVIPREALVNLADAGRQHRELLGHLLLVAAKVARQEGLEGWRTVINSGAEAGQTVFHLHVHVIGGRPLAWPPG